MTSRKNQSRRLLRVATRMSYGALLMLLSGGCADRLILYPSAHALPTQGLQRREIASGKGIIEIWTSRSPGAMTGTEPAAFVLAFIGNASRAEFVAPMFAEDWGARPIEVWAVNYPGYGGSTGPALTASIAPTALAAYDALRAVAGNRPIFLDSQSIGGTAALHVAAHRPVAGCVLHNPPPLRQLILGRFGWWNLWILASIVARSVPVDLDTIANAKLVQTPAVFVRSDADEVVPPKFQHLVYDAYAGSKRLVHVPGAKHNERADGAAFLQEQAAMDWLWQVAGP